VSTMKRRLTLVLPWFTALGVLVQLLSLRVGLLNVFFFDAMHADVQGIDYFSLPKAFLNLMARRSAYDTFGPPAFGPHITWYLAHPALALWLGSWLSFFDPMTSYGIYTMLSVASMAGCAWVLARESEDPLTRRLVWFFVMTAFPTYWMLFVGNVQALLVLALGMLLAGVFSLTYRERGEGLVLAGLLLSLFTKPAVLLMLPLLLMMKETRRAAWRALAIYATVSALFEVVPMLNPEAIGLRQVAWLAVHPSTVIATMNIYANNLHVNPWMKDNSIHWLNLVAQSGTRMMHIDIFSLPVFVDTLAGIRTPGWLYQLPLLLIFAMQVMVARIRDRRARLETGLLLLMASSLTFFLAYSTVWEYQYTGVLPVAAMLWIAREQGVSYAGPARWMAALAAVCWLPSLYFLTEGHPVTKATLTLIRFDRVVPVTLLFFAMLAVVAQHLIRQWRAGTA
jgi:hypothetical protein